MEKKRPGYFMKYSAASKPSLMVETWNWKLTNLGSRRPIKQVVGALAVDLGRLKVLVVKALADSSCGSLFAHFVVFVGGAFHVVHRGVFGTVEAGDDHLLEAQILRPRNSAGLIFSKLVHAEVRADAGDSPIVQHFVELGAFVLGQAAEAGVVVADGRAEFDGLKAGGNELLDCAGKVFGDAFSYWPGLAADRQA